MMTLPLALDILASYLIFNDICGEEKQNRVTRKKEKRKEKENMSS
jgi:hypothetical protein